MSFCAIATVAKGCGSRPIASGCSFKTAATSVASDLYSRVTSSADSPLAESS
ncbi:MAG: hypothetical protein RSF83_09280 [Hungatella sp.]